jgi:hypothetical protein
MSSTTSLSLKRAWNLLCASLSIDGLLLCLKSFPQIIGISSTVSFAHEVYYSWLGAGFFVSLTPVILYTPHLKFSKILSKRNFILFVILLFALEFFLASLIDSRKFIISSSAILLSIILLGSKIISVVLNQKEKKQLYQNEFSILQEQRKKTLFIGLFCTRIFLMILTIGIYTEILNSISAIIMLVLSMILVGLYREMIFHSTAISLDKQYKLH